jgi:sugar phosphate isomerase/epimerase
MRRRLFLGQSGCLLVASYGARGGEAPPCAMELGACTSPGLGAEIKAAGGDYIEWSVAHGLIPDQDDSVWQKNRVLASACPLPILACNSFLPGSYRCIGPEADPEKVLHYAATAFRRAEQVGIEIIVFGSAGARRLSEGVQREAAVDQFATLLWKMGQIAQEHGVTVVIEPLRHQEDNFINTVVQGAEMVERVGHPNIRLLADLYHMLQNGEDPADLQKVGHLLKHCHIAEKEGRTAPGVMGDDFRPFFSALKSVGYRGRMSIEGQWKIEQLPKAYEVIRQQLA